MIKKTELIEFPQSYSRKAGIIVTLIGCVVLLGWILDITALKSILPGLVSMKANTSIAFILSGLSLCLWHDAEHRRQKAKDNRRKSSFDLSQVLAIIVILIGLLTLIEYGFGWNLGIDELLFKDPAGAVGTSAPGRMSPNSALWLTSQFPIPGEDGKPMGIGVTVMDITARKQAEEARREKEVQLKEKNQQLEHTLQELQRTQGQLIQSEKMSSLGQLVAGIAHEINNPVNFIFGNLTHVREYTQDLLNLLRLYHQQYPNSTPEIQEEIEAIDLDFMMEDFPNLLSSMKVGADRIREIVLSLRNFSRIDEAEMKAVDIHEGIDSTLMILHNRLKAKPDHPNIQMIKEYGQLPKVECYAGQLNQVFMNLIANAIDALDEYNKQRSLSEIKANPSWIKIRTEVLDCDRVVIKIADNGSGMTEAVRQQLFNPFFTTKAIGKGTGLGLAISYQIVVEKHNGQLQCLSAPGRGAEFIIEIPLRQIV
ncbi:ATP-binding protein [Trichocoleus sp. DQ-A2]|nr:ATP-binding protein [Coleofasciculus sp. FACHB-T130]MBD1881205.1 hypothetical protein [Coleofasciculus sp. FACHB-T130]